MIQKEKAAAPGREQQPHNDSFDLHNNPSTTCDQERSAVTSGSNIHTLSSHIMVLHLGGAHD